MRGYSKWQLGWPDRSLVFAGQAICIAQMAWDNPDLDDLAHSLSANGWIWGEFAAIALNFSAGRLPSLDRLAWAIEVLRGRAGSRGIHGELTAAAEFFAILPRLR